MNYVDDIMGDMTEAKRMVMCKCGRMYDDTVNSKCPYCKPKANKAKYEKHKDLNTAKWRKFAKRIKDRDGHICMRCYIKSGGTIYTTDDLTVHHVLSREHYPELMYVDTNCLTVCRQCNGVLGTKDKLDFICDIQPLPLPNI